MDAESTELIGLGPRSHLRALERLWLLYRAPHRFREWLEQQSAGRQKRQAIMLMVHALPHMIWISAATWYSGWLIGTGDSTLTMKAIISGLNTFLVGGIGFGTMIGVAHGHASGLVFVLAFGIVLPLMFGFKSVLAFGIAFGIATALAFASAPGLTSGIFFGLFIGMFTRIDCGVACVISCTRSYYILPHLAFIWPHPRGNWYRWHPIAWDQMCSIPLPGLDRLLVNFHELQPQQAEAEIERLIDSYPSQRGSALRARVRIVARQSAKITELSQLPGIVSQLPRGDQRFLTRVPEVFGQVLAIAATHEVFRNLPVNMPAFRLRQAEQVCVVISRFRDQISGFHEPVASEFRTAALRWLTLADAQRDVSRNACEREPFPQVFRAGDPVQGQKSEAFIPRQQTIQEMAGMILASQGCPGILLYARRRMGKSTCLQNLTGFIPQNVDVAFFNLQDPVFGSLSLFIKEVRHSITECLSAEHAGNSPQNARKSRPLHSSDEKPTNARELLAGFSQFLGQVDHRLSQRNRRLLIALDEFEYLDMNIGKLDETGQPLIPESLLDLFRASIQTHRNIIWLFSGSHRIHELKHAEWPSYFISLRTVELERFSLEENSRLLTDPLAHSQLFRGDPNRPKFSPEFWGTDGLRRLHTTADGWPHLVVLLAETCVTLVNLRNAAFVTDELFEEVRKAAVISGDSVMIQLLKNESTTPGEWDYLLRFRNSDILPLPDNDTIRKSLLRRQLVAISDNQVRLRVPLMHQWIRERSELCD